MGKTEFAELTVLCLLQDGDNFLLQNRIKADWRGFTLPGGHVENGESIVDAVKREMKDETGLSVLNPKLCGIKHFPIEQGRYIVFLFTADKYSGELASSYEGDMQWVKKQDIQSLSTVDDFDLLLSVMLDDELCEFQYIKTTNGWKARIK